MERLFQDLRFAIRVLRKTPGFTILAVLSLALGIGANAAMFSLVDALLIRPLPYPDPDRLVRITEVYNKAAFVLFRQNSRSMDIARVSPGSEFNLTGEGRAVRVMGSGVSGNLLSVLGANVERGRIFAPDEDQPGRDGIVIVSHSLWQKELGGDSHIIGRSIMANGVNRQVVGIMPPQFSFPSGKVQLWVPARLDPSNFNDYWGGEFVPLIARLRPGATIFQARSDIRELLPRLWKLFPFPMPRNWNADSTVISLQSDLMGDIRSKLLTLLCSVGVVLLIACANVASLLLSRATTRRKEIALRAAVGAARSRIVRQLLTESVLLAVLGAVLGVILGTVALSIFRSVLPVDLPGLNAVRINWRVLAFTSGLSVLTGLAFGIVPALVAARMDLTESIKTGSQRSSAHIWTQLRSWLIACEIGLTVVLVMAAGLLVKSLYALSHVNPGFSVEHILTIRISPNQSYCQQRAACIAIYDRLLQEARGVSGVADVAVANTVPLDGFLPSLAVDVEDHPKSADFPAPVFWTGAITADYPQIMRIPILAGRNITEADSANSPAVVLISASTAKRFWPKQNPVGKHIKSVSETRWRTVVGVIGDVRQYDLENHSPNGISGAMYMPYAQSLQGDGQLPAAMNLIVKTVAADPSRVSAEITQAARNLNPDIPVGKVQSLRELVSDSISDFRSTIWLFLSFAIAAIILAAVGVYGLVSYSVTQRTYEMGVRVAIGATKPEVVRLIMVQSLRVAVAGTVSGVACSLVLTRFLRNLLYGVRATDPAIFVTVCMFLLVVAALASSVPAWRAAQIDPVKTLRME